MDPDVVKEKVGRLVSPCTCGSGKMGGMCCGKEEATEIAEEACPCGSGNKVKDCCMKRQEEHMPME